ncbi:MAG: YeiH family protein [Clostridia bacterium]|nr:YeiH family protein [Clostridia bacterium]
MARAVSTTQTESIFDKYTKLLPGISLCLIIGIISYFLGKEFPLIGGAVFGIVIGIALKNTMQIPASMEAGINFTAKKILKGAIIVLGAGLSLGQVWKTGMESLSVMLCTLTAAYIAAFIFSKPLRVPENLTHLIGTGTAICGASAVAALAPVIEAEDSEIAYSISTVFFFNILAVLIFPTLGHVLGLNDYAFGLWSGTAVNDTSSAVAAGYIFSDKAGEYATIVKLTRTTMIIPICLIYAAYIASKKRAQAKQSGTNFSMAKLFPWFIFGFLGASLLNTAGLFNEAVVAGANWLGKFMIIMALAAVGLQADIKQMIKTGFRPIALGMIVWFVVSVVSLLVQHFVLGHL